MATSGSNSGTITSYGITVKQEWSISSTSPANNTQTIQFKVTFTNPAGGRQLQSVKGTVLAVPTGGGTISVANTSINFGAISSSASATVKTFTTTAVITSDEVTGAAAGFKASMTVQWTIEMSGGTTTDSIAYLVIAPNALVRRSNPTVPSSITLGTEFEVITNRVNSGFTHTLQLKAGTQALTNLATGIDDSKSDCNAAINPWATYITTAASVTGTLRLITYSGNIQVGYIDKTITVNVPASLVPSISNLNFSDTNGYYSQFGGFLSGASILHLNWQEVLSYSSAIISRAVSLFGAAVSISNVSNSGCDVDISNIGTNTGTATLTITDGRGRSANATTTAFKIFQYNKPLVGNSAVYRSDANGDAVLTGDRIAIRIPWTKSSLLDENDEEQNFIKILAYIDNVLVATYGSDTQDAPNNQIIVLPGTYSDSVNQAVKLIVQDTAGQSSQYNTTMVSSSRPLSVRAFIDSETGTKSWGIAIGKVSELPDILEVDVDSIFYKQLTLTKSLKINGTDLVDTSPSANYYSPSFNTCDANGVSIGYYNHAHYTDGMIAIQLGAQRNVNGTMKYNTLFLRLDESGNASVGFAGTGITESWRNAIGAVNKAGDTMTGNLTINKDGPQTYYKSTTMNTAVGQSVPSSGETMLGGIQFTDNQNYNNGWVRVFKNSSDRVYLYNCVRRSVNGSNITNYLQLGINADGTRYVAVSESAIWRSALGVVAKAGDTMTGALTLTGAGRKVYVNNTSASTEAYIEVANSSGRVTLDVNASGNKGVWTDDGWLCFYNSSGNVAVGDRTKWRNALGVNYHWATATISVGTLAANGGEKYNQTTSYTLPSGYTACAIARFKLSGSGYTRCHIPQLEVNGAQIIWAVRNNSSTATGDLTLTVVVFCLATV